MQVKVSAVYRFIDPTGLILSLCYLSHHQAATQMCSSSLLEETREKEYLININTKAQFNLFKDLWAETGLLTYCMTLQYTDMSSVV